MMENDFGTLVEEVLKDDEEIVESMAVPFEEKYENFVSDVRSHLLGMGPVQLHELQGAADQRFSASMPMGVVRTTVIAVVGAGGIGNWVCRVLVGMGFRNVHVFDDDTVGVENVGPQAHKLIDLGLPKVEAVKREMFSFRGIDIPVHNCRVSSLSDIREAIGEMPSILIGATDSAEFRNGIIAELENEQNLDLFIDLRMSLGDWNAFLYTPRALMNLLNSQRIAIYNTYKQLAVFDPSEAVQEPCTARAITYTGANIASYVGALLHWWIVEGKRKCEVDYFWLQYRFYEDSRDGTNFNWLYRYSSKEFLPETLTTLQRKKIALASSAGMAMSAIPWMLHTRWGTTGGTYVESDVDMGQRYWNDSIRPCIYLDADGGEHLLLRGRYRLNTSWTGRVQDRNNVLPYTMDIHFGAETATLKMYPLKGRAEIANPRELFVPDSRRNAVVTEYYSESSLVRALEFPFVPNVSGITNHLTSFQHLEETKALTAAYVDMPNAQQWVKDRFVDDDNVFPDSMVNVFMIDHDSGQHTVFAAMLYNGTYYEDEGGTVYQVKVGRLHRCEDGTIDWVSVPAEELVFCWRDRSSVHSTGWIRLKSSGEQNMQLYAIDIGGNGGVSARSLSAEEKEAIVRFVHLEHRLSAGTVSDIGVFPDGSIVEISGITGVYRKLMDADAGERCVLEMVGENSRVTVRSNIQATLVSRGD